jgi:rhodanese-related sulfurtransferase
MRFKSLNPVILVVVLMAITGACATSVNQPTAVVTSAPERTAETAYRTLSIDAFADILANRADDYKIVNVHIPYEGEVENTDASIPYNDLNALTTALPDKNARIILYCRSGRMSEDASRELLKLGYTQVWDVPGGMNAWQASGRRLLDKPSQK